MIFIDKSVMEMMIKEFNEGVSVLKLSKKYPFSYDVIRRNLVENGVQMRGNSFYQSKYTLDETYFDNIDNERKAYWLGFIYADGYISKGKYGRPSFGISISKKDELHLHKFKKDIKATYPVKTYKVTGGYIVGVEYVRLLMKSSGVYNTLVSYGVDNNKSFTCVFPDTSIVPQTLTNHFIRGYFDGNGSLSKHGKSPLGKTDYEFSVCGTKHVLENINKYIPVNKELKLYQRHPDRDNNNFDLEIGGRRQVKKIMDYIYKDASVYLDRKYLRYLEFNEVYDQIYKTH